MDGATPSPAPTSAPTPSPTPSAPAAPPPQSEAPSGLQQAPEGTAPQTAPDAPVEPPKPKYPWKTKARIGDAEHELELDLAEYRHRVKVDGEEIEVPFEELGRGYERLRSSMKRYEQAAAIKKEVEQREAALTQQRERIERALTDPTSAAQLLKRALGEQGFYEMITAELAQRIEYERLPPEQRAAHDQRTQAERALAQREQEIARREQAIKAAEERRIAELAEERRRQLVAEWTPALERAGLPAKNERVLRMVAETLSSAKRAGVPMTLAEAVGQVREEYDALVSHAVEQRIAQQRAALAEQPGRADPQPPTTAPRPPALRGEPQTAEEMMRALRATWQR